MKKIRLFHIESLKIMRDIVKSLLENSGEIELIGQENRNSNLEEILAWEDANIILIGTIRNDDAQGELQNGIDLCQDIRSRFPATKIILHVPLNDGRNISKLMNAGANAVVSKLHGYQELLNAIRAVELSNKFISEEFSHLFKNTSEYLAGFSDKLVEKEKIFTRRELQVLSLISAGCTTKEIASKLYISYKTVETHRKNLVDKSNAKNTAALISFSFARGLL